MSKFEGMKDQFDAIKDGKEKLDSLSESHEKFRIQRNNWDQNKIKSYYV